MCVGNCGGPLVVEYIFFSFFSGGGELLIYVTMTTDARDVCAPSSEFHGFVFYTRYDGRRKNKEKNFVVCVPRIDEHHVPFTNFHRENITCRLLRPVLYEAPQTC